MSDNNFHKLMISFGILFILIHCASCKHEKYDADKFGIRLLDTTLTYKDYNYPAVKSLLINFSVLAPGIIMLPLQGGIYMPNFNSWYLKPSKEPLLSASTNLADATLYYCKNLLDLSMILQVSKNNNTNQVTVVDTFELGFYNVITAGHETYYVIGLNAKGYHIWERENGKRQLLFESNKPISAFTAINKDAYIMCWDKKLVLMRKGSKPVVLGAFETAADGIAVDGNGKIFVSSGNMIYRIESKDKFKPLLAGIHGVLQYFSGKLYVLWQEKSKIIAFNLNFKPDRPFEISKAIQIIRSMSNNCKDGTFNKAIKNAQLRATSSEKDFVTIFGEEFETIDPNAKLAAIFATKELQDKISFPSTNEEVLAVIRKTVEKNNK